MAAACGCPGAFVGAGCRPFPYRAIDLAPRWNSLILPRFVGVERDRTNVGEIVRGPGDLDPADTLLAIDHRTAIAFHQRDGGIGDQGVMPGELDIELGGAALLV